MVNYIKINTNDIYCVGDIHGQFDDVFNFIEKYNIDNATMVFCGDVGLGFQSISHYNRLFDKLNEFCCKRNLYLLFVRGNHDNPFYYADQHFNNKHKYVRTIPDYTVVQLFDLDDIGFNKPPYNILCVGGAVSVDRKGRIDSYKHRKEMFMKEFPVANAAKSIFIEDIAESFLQKTYWEDEEFVLDEEKITEILKDNVIDCVVTHTAPDFCEPLTTGNITHFIGEDKKLNEELIAERKNVSILYDLIVEKQKEPIKYWMYGHFHNSWNITINDTRFIMLDMLRHHEPFMYCINTLCERMMEANILFLDIDGVLNSDDYFNSEQYYNNKETYPLTEFDERIVKCLKEIIKECNAKIVLTSQWRGNFIEMDNLFKKLGIEQGIYGQTEYHRDNRAEEIRIWLRKHNYINNIKYVIVDDEHHDFDDEQLKRFVKTDYSLGLTDKKKDEIIAKFMGEVD